MLQECFTSYQRVLMLQECFTSYQRVLMLQVQECVCNDSLHCGIAYIHENGFCHRDIKPENCMIETATVGAGTRFVIESMMCVSYGVRTMHGLASYAHGTHAVHEVKATAVERDCHPVKLIAK
jgi:serine/threonine protein kinase